MGTEGSSAKSVPSDGAERQEEFPRNGSDWWYPGFPLDTNLEDAQILFGMDGQPDIISFQEIKWGSSSLIAQCGS
jgi:hypothetical protein